MLNFIKLITLLTLLNITLQTLNTSDNNNIQLTKRDSKAQKSKELTRTDFPVSELGSLKLIEKETNSIKAFYLIVINPTSKQLGDWKKTIQSLNSRFSYKNPYPYIILSETELSSDEKKEFEALTDSNVKFGLFDINYNLPKNIDIIKVGLNFNELKLNVDKKEGDDIKVHQLNRYKAGFIFEHILIKEYDYYMRLEPNSKFLCNFKEDPFLTLKQNGKEYGFIQTKVLEDKRILSLWDTIANYIELKDAKIAKKNSKYFITRDDEEKEFNYCSFRSQVELGSVKLFKSDTFKNYFDHLDQEGGFFNELWDDTSIQSIYIALFLEQSKIYWFGKEIGYEIKGRLTCPKSKVIRSECDCDSGNNNDGNSCYNWVEMKKAEEELKKERLKEEEEEEEA